MTTLLRQGEWKFNNLNNLDECRDQRRKMKASIVEAMWNAEDRTLAKGREWSVPVLPFDRIAAG